MSWTECEAAGNPYDALARVEQSLYAKQYANQTLGLRLSRIELSLMGQTQAGSYQTRLETIEQRLSDLREERSAANEQERTLSFIERRFYQRVHSHQALSQRLDQLETTVYGQPQPQFPLQQRLSRLRQAVPLRARQIQLDTVSADNQPVSTQPESVLLPEPPPVINSPDSRHMPDASRMIAPVPQSHAEQAMMAVPGILPSESQVNPENWLAGEPAPSRIYTLAGRHSLFQAKRSMTGKFQCWLLQWWLSVNGH